jgi:hypothetical protein
MLYSHSPDIACTTVNIVIDNNDDLPLMPVSPLSQVNDQCEPPAIKYLWVFIDSKFNFRYHINQISNKLSRAFFYLRKYKHF